MSHWNRDSQRQKVYNAEGSWERMQYALGGLESETITIAQGQEWLDLLAEHFECRPVMLKQNRKIRQWGGWYKPYAMLIEVPGSKLSLKTLAHEFAHHLEDMRQAYLPEVERRKYNDPGHGAMYTETMLDVVHAIWGDAPMHALAQSYMKHNVLVGRLAAIERKQKQEKAREARNKRIGERGTVYIVGNGLAEDIREHTYWADGQYWVNHWQNAKAYRTLKGAKNAAQTFMRATIYKTEGVYNVTYGVWRESDTPIWQVMSEGKPQAVMTFTPSQAQ